MDYTFLDNMACLNITTHRVITQNDISIKPASTMCVCGPSKCGKTFFINELLKNRGEMYQNGDYPKKVLFCYSIYQQAYDRLQEYNINVSFIEGIPDMQTITDFADGEHNIIILDDLMTEVVKTPDMEKLFTVGSHHLNLSVCFLSQNLFQGGKHSRSISLNTEYYVLFKNPRDGGQVASIGRQMGKMSSAVLEAYRDISQETPFGYLFLDLTQKCDDDLRIRTKIFPSQMTVVYRARRGVNSSSSKR